MSRNPNPYTMTTTEAALLFRVKPRTVVDWCARGRLDAIKVKSGAKDIWMINPAGQLRSKAEPTFALWCQTCEEFFIFKEGRKCPRCGWEVHGYDPVEVEPDDLA